MRLTRATTYALQALTYMAQYRTTGPMPSHLAARARGVPERFLLKIFKPLVSARVLRSVRGPNGGYSLARPAKAITLLEIVEAVDGPIRGDAPAVAGAKTNRLDRKLGQVCDQAAKRLREQLQKVTLAGLLD
jgi:Rrf2 family protein